MSSKNFIHSPSQLVAQALRSLPLINPTLVVDEAEKVVRYVPEHTAGSCVSIISGGGAGHEPAFAGYVGQGLLSAAVSGTIFASPNANQILHAIESIDVTKGVLITVMNYTGDVLNFGVAVERAKARRPSLRIKMLTIGDDVGVPRSQAGKVGRRGIAGTCLIHKITGAAAAQGRSLDQLMSLGRMLAENLVSVGVSLDRVHIPGQPTTIDAERVLHEDEVELGMGIHNEAGSGRRRGAKAKLDLLVSEMLDQLISQADDERSFLKTISPEAVLLVNNLGGLSPLELGAITTEATEQLHSKYCITTPRIYSGTFMTSLNGPGFSLSLLFLQPSNYEEIIGMLDFPTDARGWNGPSGSQAWRRASPGNVKGDTNTDTKDAQQPTQLSHRMDFTCDVSSVIGHLQGALQSVIEAEPEITKFDSVVGDGDCGTTLKRGAEELLGVCREQPSTIERLLGEVVAAVERSMDGTSGAIYSIFLNALYAHFLSRSGSTIDSEFWITALVSATDALSKYTPAKKGDRTLMDALIPFQEALLAGNSLHEAAKIAVNAAEETKFLKARLGRSVYVGEQESWVGIVPDPGAWGLSKFFMGMAQATE